AVPKPSTNHPPGGRNRLSSVASCLSWRCHAVAVFTCHNKSNMAGFDGLAIGPRCIRSVRGRLCTQYGQLSSPVMGCETPCPNPLLAAIVVLSRTQTYSEPVRATMPSAATAFLVVKRDDGFGDVFQLVAGQRYNMGRATSNRIVLKDDLCSR